MSRDSLKCRIETAFDSLEGMREAWDRFAVEVGSPVYMSYDWLRLWWRFYGDRSKARLFIFTCEEELVALLPVYLSVLGLPPFHIRVARLIGANIPPKVFNPPVRPEFAGRVWSQALNHLFKQERCDVVSLGPLSETYGSFEPLKEVAAGEGEVWDSGTMAERDVHTVYHLPKTFDEFLASVDRKEMKVRRRKLRDLESKGPLRVEVVKDSPGTETEFESFVQQHSTQWEAEGRPGHFGAWPHALEYNRELVRTHGRLGRVRFVRLLVGDQVVANQYNYAFGRSLFAELPSRVAGPEWERLSLGCSSQVKLLEAVIQEGFATMESGLGHYDYKVLLGGREHRVLTVRLRASGALSHARNRACSALRDMLVLFSQKLWYKRISPLLPRRLRSGQSETTLAYDF